MSAGDGALAVELVTIGDELLLGFTIDTNAAHLARTLAGVGGRIVRRASVGDDAAVIAAAVREALDRTGAVITTGGLGPTADDMTREAIAGIFGRRLVLDAALLADLEARWQKRFNHPLPPSNRQQVMIPEGAEVLPNRHGSAPGIWLEDAAGRWVAMLPGVPREMRGMLADTLLPRLQGRLAGAAQVVRSRTVRTVGIAESALADRLGALARTVEGLPLAYLPGAEGVDLRVTAPRLPPDEADARLGAAVEALRARVGAYVYGEEDADLAALVVQGCRVRGWTVAVAESCTGGMLGMRLTAVPGASDVVQGGHRLRQRRQGAGARGADGHPRGRGGGERGGGARHGLRRPRPLRGHRGDRDHRHRRTGGRHPGQAGGYRMGGGGRRRAGAGGARRLPGRPARNPLPRSTGGAGPGAPGAGRPGGGAAMDHPRLTTPGSR